MDVEDSATVEERLNDHLYRAPFIPTSRRQSGRRNALTLIFRFILMRPFETRPVSFFPSVAPLPSPPLPSPSLSHQPTTLLPPHLAVASVHRSRSLVANWPRHSFLYHWKSFYYTENFLVPRDTAVNRRMSPIIKEWNGTTGKRIELHNKRRASAWRYRGKITRGRVGGGRGRQMRSACLLMRSVLAGAGSRRPCRGSPEDRI